MTANVAPFPYRADFSIPGLSARKLEQDGATAAAYARGFDDGRADEQAAGAHRIAAGLERVAESLDALHANFELRWQALEREAASVALEAAELLTGMTLPETVIAEAFHNALDAAGTPPQLRIVVHADLVERLTPLLTRINGQRLTPAPLTIEPDAAMPTGDCRIEWAGGCIARDRAALETAMRDAFCKSFPPITGPSS